MTANLRPSGRERATGLTRAWPAVVLIALVTLAYWPGRGGGYVFDDYPNIVDNTALHVSTLQWNAWIAALFSSDSGPLHRPLAMATFAINHYFTGLDPVPMKLTNIGIHALNAVLVLGLVRTLLALAAPAVETRRREWTARFAAAAWALHPINLLAVLFVVQRMESLSHTFVFAGLWLYLLGRQGQLAGESGGGWRILVGVIGGTALGALAKESAILLPLYAACIELCLLGARNASGRRDRRLLGFYTLVLVIPALLALAWLLPRYLPAGAYANRDFTLAQRLLTEGRVVVDYLRWTLVPSLRELSLYHDDFPISHGLLQPLTTLLAYLALLALAAGGWWLRKRRPLVALGIAWFLAAQLLTATFIPLELVYEHRNYLASLGVCLVLADLLLLAPKHETLRRIGALLAVVWLLGVGLTTHLRAREWRDPLRFAASEAAKHPQSPRATYSHARLLAMATGYRADSPLLPQAFQALEHARAVPDSGILPHSALLVLAARTGQPVQTAWWDELITRLRHDPIGAQETNAIGSIAHCARDRLCAFPPANVLAMFQAALSQHRRAEVLNIYADYVFNVIHQPATAIYLWRQAIAMKPGEAQYRINLAKVLISLGGEREARHAIAQLRATGRLGANEAAARGLEARLQRARQTAAHPAPDQGD